MLCPQLDFVVVLIGVALFLAVGGLSRITCAFHVIRNQAAHRSGQVLKGSHVVLVDKKAKHPKDTACVLLFSPCSFSSDFMKNVSKGKRSFL